VFNLDSVALIGAEVELLDYVNRCLHLRWPRIVSIRSLGDCVPCETQLCIRTSEPVPPMSCRTLWLDGIGRRPRLARLAPQLWRAPIPLGRRHLIRVVESILAAAGTE
jgi:hypothetical protein